MMQPSGCSGWKWTSFDRQSRDFAQNRMISRCFFIPIYNWRLTFFAKSAAGRHALFQHRALIGAGDLIGRHPICLDIVRRFLYPVLMVTRSPRTEKLDLRLSKAAKQTLQAAATASRKTVSEFVLESALSEAEERLADRRVFTLGAQQWDAFVAALDAPPRRHARLEKLFREPSVFDPEP